jgi:hypothetical protein
MDSHTLRFTLSKNLLASRQAIGVKGCERSRSILARRNTCHRLEKETFVCFDPDSQRISGSLHAESDAKGMTVNGRGGGVAKKVDFSESVIVR